VGGIGLGAGTIAGYCLAGDTFRFYEINSEVVRFSQEYFTYLSYCKELGGEVEVKLGDGRQLLQKEWDQGKRQQYDILVVDAFNGVSIPTHLLTKEAIELYLSQVKPSGVVAFHTTSTYFNLVPVIAASVTGKQVYVLVVGNQEASWVLLAKEFRSEEWILPRVRVKPWTDDYISLRDVIMWEALGW